MIAVIFLIILNKVLVHYQIIHAIKVVVIVLLIHAPVHVLPPKHIHNVVLLHGYRGLLPLQSKHLLHLEHRHMLHVLAQNLLLLFPADAQLGIDFIYLVVDFPRIML